MDQRRPSDGAAAPARPAATRRGPVMRRRTPAPSRPTTGSRPTPTGTTLWVEREEQIVEVLRGGWATPEEIAAKIYGRLADAIAGAAIPRVEMTSAAAMRTRKGRRSIRSSSKTASRRRTTGTVGG